MYANYVSIRLLSVWEICFQPSDVFFGCDVPFGTFVAHSEGFVGELVKKREYSTKRGERRTRYGNTFFDEYFGTSDFQEVNPILLKRGGPSRYLVKYIIKSGEKALYSRGTPAEICKELSENDEVGTYFDYVMSTYYGTTCWIGNEILKTTERKRRFVYKEL